MGYKTNRRTGGVFSTNNPSVGALGHERYACTNCRTGIVQGTEYEMDGKIYCHRCWNDLRVVQLTDQGQLTTKAEYARLADEYADVHGGRDASGNYWYVLTRPTNLGYETAYSDTMINFPSELEARRYGDLLVKGISTRKYPLEYEVRYSVEPLATEQKSGFGTLPGPTPRTFPSSGKLQRNPTK